MSNFTTGDLPLAKSLEARGMLTEEKRRFVYLSQPNLQVLSQVTSIIGGESEEVNQLEYFQPRIGNTGISKVIDNRVVDGNSLILELRDTESREIREGDAVLSSSTEVYGYVTDTSKGRVVIIPWGKDIFDPEDFSANTNADVHFDISPNDDSNGKRTGRTVPEFESNLVGFTRETHTMTAQDLFTGSYPVWEDYGGEQLWSHGQWQETRRKFGNSLEVKYLNSHRERKENAEGEDMSTPDGIIQQVIKRGQSMSYTSMPDRKMFSNIASRMIDEGGSGPNEKLCLVGTEFMQHFQDEIAGPYIQQVGQANTIGGASVEGFDATRWKIMGTDFVFVAYNVFNNRKFFSARSKILGNRLKKSGACLMLDLNPVPRADGGGEIPAIKKYHFSNEEMSFRYVPGMIGPNGAAPSTDQIMSHVLTSSSRDSFSIEYIVRDSLMLHAAERCAFLEPAY